MYDTTLRLNDMRRTVADISPTQSAFMALQITKPRADGYQRLHKTKLSTKYFLLLLLSSFGFRTSNTLKCS